VQKKKQSMASSEDIKRKTTITTEKKSDSQATASGLHFEAKETKVGQSSNKKSSSLASPAAGSNAVSSAKSSAAAATKLRVPLNGSQQHFSSSVSGVPKVTTSSSRTLHQQPVRKL